MEYGSKPFRPLPPLRHGRIAYPLRRRHISPTSGRYDERMSGRLSAIIGDGEGDRHILLIGGSDVRPLFLDGDNEPLRSDNGFMMIYNFNFQFSIFNSPVASLRDRGKGSKPVRGLRSWHQLSARIFPQDIPKRIVPPRRKTPPRFS